jgi:hypothetical protein
LECILVYKLKNTYYILMDTETSLKLPGELEGNISDEDSFLRDLASFFAHKQMRNLLSVPEVISVYSFRDNYGSILQKFESYLNAELCEEFKNGQAGVRPRVVISKQDEPNTYSIPVDFFLERRKMPGLPISLLHDAKDHSVIYTHTSR